MYGQQYNMPPATQVMNRGTPQFGDGAVNVITQEKLSRLKFLRELAAELDNLRQNLRAMLEMGAPIEPGPLTAELRIQTSYTFTAANLTPLLGAEYVENLKRLIPGRTVRQVVLRAIGGQDLGTDA